MIDRRAFIRGSTMAILAAPLAPEPRPLAAGVVPRVGVLGEANPIPWTVRTSAAEIECRWTEGRSDRLGNMAAELVSLEVNALVAIGATATRAFKRLTTSLPIVFVAGGDPVQQGLVDSLARPGANVTGLLVPSEAEVAGERLRLLADILPGARKVAVLSHPDCLTNAHAFEHLRGRAWPVVDLYPFRARNLAEAERAFIAMRKEEVDGLLVLPDPLFAIPTRQLVSLAAESGVPSIYAARSFAEAGGLMALHGDTAEIIRRTVAIVTRILGGASPATLPVESLTRLELTVNAGTARRLGLTLPTSLLARADAVIRT